MRVACRTSPSPLEDLVRVVRPRVPARRPQCTPRPKGRPAAWDSADGGRRAQAGLARAGLSPVPPYFQLGLFGFTIPALAIEGEIGQQLGYINAITVGMIDFAILVLFGLALSRPDSTRRLSARLSGGRLKAPVTDPYGS